MARKPAALAAPSTAKELKDLLWKSADKLRGSMDASQYKDVVLGLVFLKYVSDAFEERQEQIWDELMYCARMIEREVDRPPDQTYLCACAICGHPVFGPEHLDEVECRRCREVVGAEGYVPVYSRTEEKQRSKDALQAEHVPAADLRTAVHHAAGLKVNRRTMHSWITRQRLQAKACRAYTWVSTDQGKALRPAWSHRKDDVAHTLLYLVGDAVKLAQDIPLRDLQAGDDTEDDRVETDHEGAYLKVLRVIQDAGGAA